MSGEVRAVNPLRWAPALVGLSSAAALVVAAQARMPVVAEVPEPLPQPPVVELMGPPKPEAPKLFGPPLPAELVAKRSAALAKAVPAPPAPGGLPGRIGPIGPIEGPLNAQVPEGGPIFGPNWDRNPLPRLPNASQFLGPVVATVNAPKPAEAPASAAPSGTGEAGSELPDATKLEISRAANPTLEVRNRTTQKADASPERPVALNLVLSDGGSRAVGDAVVVRLTANVDSYFVVMRVDATGKAATVFQSSRPAQRVACVVKAGPEAGAEYLVAVASVRSLNSEDVTAALKGAGAGFTTMPAGAEAGSQPGQAWSTILAHAGSVGGSATPSRWQRHEWDVATSTFATVTKAEKPAPEAEKPVESKTAGARAATGKSVAVKLPAAKVAAPKPLLRKPAETGDGSALPGGKPEGTAPEKPAGPQGSELPGSTGAGAPDEE